MKLMRNKEVIRTAGLFALAGAGLGLAGFILHPTAGVIALIASVLFIALYLLRIRRVYTQIGRLSDYLKCVQNGQNYLDMRDNSEGELGILKSEIYKVTNALHSQARLLEGDKTYLADSISDISHQLKTPLTSLQVLTDLLYEEDLSPEKQQEFLHTIRTQLNRIHWLVSALLKLSKLDAGTAGMQKGHIRVSSLVEAAIMPVALLLEVRGQTMEVDGDPDAMFTGDLNWTAEALANILKNCAEHTPKEGVLRIKYSENSLFTEIKISDTGSGIYKEDLPYIFKRFYRGKNASSDSVGIGLAIAYSIVQQQRGDIIVQSKVGEGSTFTIRFYKTVY